MISATGEALRRILRHHKELCTVGCIEPEICIFAQKYCFPMKRLLFAIAASALLYLGSAAQSSARDEVLSNVRFAHPTYSTYPLELITEQRCVPKGYTPFYVSHYARHGSRNYLSESSFLRVAAPLEKAQQMGLLTELGEEVLSILKADAEVQHKKYGKLTEVGKNQHEGIAARLFERYPEIFANGGKVCGQASSSSRSTKSMYAFADKLRELSPRLIVELSSDKDVQLVVKPQSSKNPEYTTQMQKDYDQSQSSKIKDGWRAEEREWKKTCHFSSMSQKLFKDAPAVFRETKYSRFAFAMDLLGRLVFGANYGCSHDELVRELFSDEQLWNAYLYETYRWFYRKSAEDDAAVRRFTGLSHLLIDDIVRRADEVIAGESDRVADIRFGHDSFLVPLVSCMGLDGCCGRRDEIENIAQMYRMYRISPMAGNVQLIFYRGKNSKDILVRIMLNENLASIPLKTKTPGFYRWKDVKEFWKQRTQMLRQ